MSREQRPNLRRPKYGSITQGTVFSCAQAARYIDCDVFGLTITARCDTALRKYPVLNYLPIVKLRDWFRRDGLDILLEIERNEQIGQLNRMLRQANVAETLPRSVALRKIAEVHFPLGEGNKAQKTVACSCGCWFCDDTEKTAICPSCKKQIPPEAKRTKTDISASERQGGHKQLAGKAAHKKRQQNHPLLTKQNKPKLASSGIRLSMSQKP